MGNLKGSPLSAHSLGAVHNSLPQPSLWSNLLLLPPTKYVTTSIQGATTSGRVEGGREAAGRGFAPTAAVHSGEGEEGGLGKKVGPRRSRRPPPPLSAPAAAGYQADSRLLRLGFRFRGARGEVQPWGGGGAERRGRSPGEVLRRGRRHRRSKSMGKRCVRIGRRVRKTKRERALGGG
uniref:Uncharacterized protein n=1 Tax=Oryza nivara TaxID=4536 RepID=A0A0E0HPU7_ORYNI